MPEAKASGVPRRHHRRRLRRWLLVGGGALFIGLAVLGANLYFRYLPAARALQDGRDAVAEVRGIMDAGVSKLDNAKLDQLSSLLGRAAADFGSKSQVIETGWLLDIGGRLPFLGDQVTALRSLRTAGHAGTQLGMDLLPVLRQALPPSAEASSKHALTRLIQVAETQGSLLDQLMSDLDAFDAAAARIPATAHLLGPLDAGRSLVQSVVPRLDSSVRPAVGLLRALPRAAGAGQHRYLLLLDNPGEERPGGGFIGAIGELTISEGAVVDRSFRSSDFANALVTSLPAPHGLDVTLFHGQPWELSDSNWSPDFPTSAAAAAHFYQLATGRTVDGVIGVDPVALSYVLAVTGPLAAPPYPQTVGPDSTLLTLNEIINKARPGDPGKAYLAPFGAAVLDRILAAPLSEDPGIAAALVRGAVEKHIVMSLNDAALMAKADAAGFSGRVPNPPSDSLQLVDANVGGNKADLIVKRQFALTATVGSDGQVKDTLTLRYQNPAQTDPALQALVAQFNGEYRDYLRVYIPETASLQSMTLQEGTSTVTVSPESIDFELNREAVDYLLVVPAGQTATLTLTYTGPFVDNTVARVQYTLDWAKEIGAPAWPVMVTVNAGSRQERYSSDLNVDRSWTVAAG